MKKCDFCGQDVAEEDPPLSMRGLDENENVVFDVTSCDHETCMELFLEMLGLASGMGSEPQEMVVELTNGQRWRIVPRSAEQEG